MEIYDFGLRLKELRESKQLSQQEVAERLSVGRSTISGYERNTITPSVEQLVRMAVLYNTSLDYMMGIDDRTCLFLDDLDESQQQAVIDIVDRLKRESLRWKCFSPSALLYAQLSHITIPVFLYYQCLAHNPI